MTFPVGPVPGSQPHALTTFRDDGGNVGLATADYGDGLAWVYRGDGTGKFGVGVSLDGRAAALQTICSADFNNDGLADLVVSNWSFTPNDLGTFWGGADGGFDAVAASAVGTSATLQIMTADVNGDSLPDLVFISGSNLYVGLGQGDGGFLWSAPITGIGSPRGITVGNFGGAGASQIALADNGSNDVEILVSDDGGTFAPLQSTWGVGNGPVGIASADFNGDGCLDVATADNSSASMTVLLNTCSDAGSIDFEKGTTYFIGGGRPQWLVTADLNQDGYPDLAMAFYDPAPGGGNIAVFLNKGDGSFPQTPTYLTAGSGASWIVSADFNNDTKPDLAVVNKDSDNLSVFLGQ